MSTQNTNTAKNAPLPIISENVADDLTDAFKVIFDRMASHGAPLGITFDAAGRPEYERVAVRALDALKARQGYLKEQAVAQFRNGVRDAISPHIDAARAEKAEYDTLKATMSEKLAKMLAPFPTYIMVPMSDVSEVFGEGVEVSAQVKKLVDMGYKVSKGQNNAYSLRIELPKSITGETPAK